MPKYTGCGNPRCEQSVLRGVHAALCWSLCSPLVLFAVLFCCDFRESKQTRTSTYVHPMYPEYMIRMIIYVRSLPRNNLRREIFAVLYRAAIVVAFGSRCLCRTRCNARSCASFGCQQSKHNSNAPPCVFFGCRARLSKRSIISPEAPMTRTRPNFKNFC